MPEASTGLPSGYDVRETADEGTGAPAPTQTGSRTFTEGEAYALVADNVQRETAAKTAEIEKLTAEKADLQAKLETADATAASEKAAREKAEQELKDLQDKQAREEAAAAVRDERVSKVKDTAKHLGEDYFTKERADRWAGMEQEAFDAWISELAELSKGIEAPKGGSTTGAGGAPRETAMAGSSVSGGGGSDKPKGLAALGSAFPTASKGGN